MISHCTRSHRCSSEPARPAKVGRQRRRGAAASELAVVLPLLLVLCATSVDFGRFAHTYVVVSNAARLGAERGATKQFTDYTYASWRDDVESTAREELTSLAGFESSSATVDVETTPDAYDLQRIQVAVTYPFETVVRWPFIPKPVWVRCQVSMRQYR